MRLANQSRAIGLLLLVTLAATLGAQPSAVILVRHAEKAATPANDPLLTPAGTQRAADLAAALSDAHVSAIITTQLERTKATARPLADAAKITPVIVPASSDVAAHVNAVVAAVASRPAGAVVLVVGHSNTIPAIIAALGGPKMPDLCDQQYSGLFVLQLRANGPPSFVRGKYGAPDPADADACTRTMKMPPTKE
jgi:broad specificity phosphatase PhoE